MPFPITPLPGEDERQFLVQDPWDLRKKIIPLLEYDNAAKTFTGLGTAFQIDPFGTFLTAQHVCDNLIQTGIAKLSSSQIVVGLLSPGLVIGSTPIPHDCFVTLRHGDTFRGLATDPLSKFQGRHETQNIFDCIKIQFHKNERLKKQTTFLPVRIHGRQLCVGDRVMALGYPEIKVMHEDSGQTRLTYSERMCGAVGIVTELIPQGLGRTYPWPAIEVSAKWLGGMSGGPIFNEDGEVIGIVSSSLAPTDETEGRGHAFWFQPHQRLDKWLPTIDPVNPGWFRGWAALRYAPWHLAGMFETRQDATAHCQMLGEDYEIRYGSNRYGSDDFI